MTKRAILLANLGSPEQANISAVRHYLNQFLMDPYVIQLPWLLRRLLVSLFVLPNRPKTAAKAYKRIWMDEGSPLLVLSQHLQTALQAQLNMPVAIAMRYGEPSIEKQMLALAKQPDITEILFIPLYPHYADSTVTTSIKQAYAVIKKHQLNIALKIIPPFYEQADYIDALVASARPYLEQQYDHILFSYHGLPESHITKLDTSGQHCLKQNNCCQQAHDAHKTCYRHQVFKTTHCFADKANLSSSDYSISFQSRLSRAKWLAPNTEDRLRELAASDAKNILLICPSFVTDCLETLEEITLRGQTVFCDAGGESLTLIPCLNAQAQWVKTLAAWCR